MEKAVVHGCNLGVMVSSMNSEDSRESVPHQRKFVLFGMSGGGGGGGEGRGDHPYEISGGDGRESLNWFKLMQRMLGDVVEHRGKNRGDGNEESADVVTAIGFEEESFTAAVDKLETMILSLGQEGGDSFRPCVDRIVHSVRETTEFTRRQYEWRSVFEQMRCCYSVGLWLISGLDLNSKAEALAVLSSATADGIRALVDGAADEINPHKASDEEDTHTYRSIDVHPWSSAIEAREHTLRAALAARYVAALENEIDLVENCV